jgi:hypothetical protein
MRNFFTVNYDLLVAHFCYRKGCGRYVEALWNAKENDALSSFAGNPLCEDLLSTLFPKSIMNLFGGYQRFLSLPSFNPIMKDVSYIVFSEKCFPNDENLVIGLSPISLRPVIGLKVIKKMINNAGEAQEKTVGICYHARYSKYNVGLNWVRGELPFGGGTLWDLPEYDPEEKIKKGEFHDLQSLLQGKMVSWTSCEGNYEVRLAPSREVALLQKERKRLQERLQEERLQQLLLKEEGDRKDIHSQMQRFNQYTEMAFRLFQVPGAEKIVEEQLQKEMKI